MVRPQPLAALLLVCIGATASSADVFELKTGGRLEGDLIKRGERDSYVIKTTAGATVEVAKLDLVRIETIDPTKLEYRIRSRTEPDNAASHRRLAEWCQKRGLAAERKHHLTRLLQLAPNDQDARRGLGFQQVGDRWMTREQIMAARGMRWHAGRYRSEQEIELVELDKMREQAEAHWFSELKRWKGWLRHRRPERVREAQAAIAAIEDPHAAPALVRWLDNENDEWTRRLLLDVLYLLDHPLVMSTLVDLSIHEETDDLRLLCVDYLTRDRRRPPLKPYVDWLSSKDNRIVNRAAQALAAIGDGEAVSPLIDALVTRHKFIVSTGNPGQINASMTNGGGGFTAGGNAPKVEFRDLNNTDVLRALSQLTGGVDFGYDERAWRRWFVNEQKVDFSASRRDL